MRQQCPSFDAVALRGFSGGREEEGRRRNLRVSRTAWRRGDKRQSERKKISESEEGEVRGEDEVRWREWDCSSWWPWVRSVSENE